MSEQKPRVAVVGEVLIERNAQHPEDRGHQVLRCDRVGLRHLGLLGGLADDLPHLEAAAGKSER